MKVLGWVTVSLLLCAADLGFAATTSSALFCQPAHGGYNIFAGRLLRNGKLEFAISEWLKNGQAFNFYGVARRSGKLWRVDKGRGENACRITIDWHGRGGASVKVDPRANCEKYAGYGFGSKSVRFWPADFKKPVTTELSGSLIDPDPCA